MSNNLPIMDEEHHRRFELNPIFIGLLGIIAGPIMVATYYCIALGCCQRRTSSPPNRPQSPENSQEQTNSTSNPRITLIPVFPYGKESNKGMCSVCLCEFNDGEQIRVLPECSHFFHVACIDMWLNSHSNCPLCRTNTIPPQHVVLSLLDSGGVTPWEFQRQLSDFGG